jgi:hypothetical protein
MLGLLDSLAASGNPLALMLADKMPESPEEIPEEYRVYLPNQGPE